MEAYLAGLEAAQPAGHDLNTIHLGRLVLRLPGRHRDRQTAGGDRHRGGPGAARPGRRRQRPTRLRRLRRSVRLGRAVDTAGSGRRLGATSAVGLDRCEEPGLLRHPLRHRTGGARHRQHDAREDPRRRRRPRRVTGDTITGTAAASQEVFDNLEAVGIDLGDVFRHLEDDGVDKFEKSWHELLDATQAQLDAAKK